MPFVGQPFHKTIIIITTIIINYSYRNYDFLWPTRVNHCGITIISVLTSSFSGSINLWLHVLCRLDVNKFWAGANAGPFRGGVLSRGVPALTQKCSEV